MGCDSGLERTKIQIQSNFQHQVLNCFPRIENLETRFFLVPFMCRTRTKATRKGLFNQLLFNNRQLTAGTPIPISNKNNQIQTGIDFQTRTQFEVLLFMCETKSRTKTIPIYFSLCDRELLSFFFLLIFFKNKIKITIII